MNIDLPSDIQAQIDRLVAAGRYPTSTDAIMDGIRLLISRERLKEHVGIGVAQADAGDFVDHDTIFGQLRTIAQAGSGDDSR